MSTDYGNYQNIILFPNFWRCIIITQPECYWSYFKFNRAFISLIHSLYRYDSIKNLARAGHIESLNGSGSFRDICYSNLVTVKKFIYYQSHINVKDGLKSACKAGQLDIVKYLCENFKIKSKYIRNGIMLAHKYNWNYLETQLKNNRPFLEISDLCQYLKITKNLYDNDDYSFPQLIEALKLCCKQNKNDIFIYIWSEMNGYYLYDSHIYELFSTAYKSQNIEIINFLNVKYPSYYNSQEYSLLNIIKLADLQEFKKQCQDLSGLNLANIFIGLYKVSNYQMSSYFFDCIKKQNLKMKWIDVQSLACYDSNWSLVSLTVNMDTGIDTCRRCGEFHYH